MIPRAVLDTNVFVSAALFEGIASRLVSLWQTGKFLYLLTRPILDEYLRVLAYPKFELTDSEIKGIIEGELLPFVEVVPLKNIRVPRLKDRDDEKFLEAALLGKAAWLITEDRALLALGEIGSCKMISVAEALRLAAPV